MWTNLRLLLWLDRKRIGDKLAYWLKILGIDDDSTLAYQFYAVGFYIFWIFAMWSYVVESAFEFQKRLPSDAISVSQNIVPYFFPLVLIVAIIWLLRDPPLKLSAPDIDILATSPIRRGSVAIVYALRSILPIAFLGAVISSLYALLIIWDLELVSIVRLSLVATGVSFLLLLSIGLLAWALAIIPLNQWDWVRRGGIYTIATLILAVLFIPAVGNIVGALWLDAVIGEISILQMLLLIVIVGGSIALLYWSGEGVHLSLVANRSRTYARIQKLGMLGQFYARDLIRQIRQQERLASRRRFLKMPRTQNPLLTMFSRAVLSQWRTSGWKIIFTPFKGVSYAGIAIVPFLLADIAAWQSWLVVIIFFVRSRPSVLVERFAQQRSSAFMEQFARGNTFENVLANCILPMVLVSIGAVGFLLLLPTSFIPAYNRMLAIALALACVGIFTWAQVINLLKNRIAYEYTIIAATIAVVLAGVVTQTLDIPLFVALAINMVMLSIIREGE